MSQPLNHKQTLHQKAHRLNDAETQAKAELQRIQSLRDEVNAELEAESKAEAEALTLASKAGIPPDLARRRIDAERRAARSEGSTDVFKMSRAQYAEHKRARGL